MTGKVLRRDALRWMGAGALGWIGAPSLLGLVGCGDSNGNAADAGLGDAGMGDAGMADAWWLEGNFAPVSEEVTHRDLTVEGALPPELTGLYVRNGSNPMGGATGHWFVGDGMLHGVRLDNGQARWYRNRWVQTPILGQGFGSGSPPGLMTTASNVSLVHHAGHLLSLGEVGLPMEIDPSDLSTQGFYDFSGKLMTNMTAHPVVDPENGDLLFFGYNFSAPYLTYHRANAAGELLQSEPIEIGGPAMMHSFAQTERFVIFMDLPVVFSLQAAIDGEAFPYGWDESYNARLGVMPKTGGNADVQWFDVDPCFVFHIMNAFEDVADSGERIHLDVARYEALWVHGSEDFDRPAHLTRFTLDLDTGRVTESQLDDRVVEFPQIDQRRSGRGYRYGYTIEISELPGSQRLAEPAGLLKFDHERGTSSRHQLPAGDQPGEVIFVPASEGAGEDEGYLLTFMYRAATNTSDLVVLDASDMTADPIARVKLPVRVPAGFHGHWVPMG